MTKIHVEAGFMKTVFALLSFFLVLAAVSGIFWYTGLTEQYTSSDEINDYSRAEALIKEEKPEDAMAIISRYHEKFEKPASQPNWLLLAIKAYELAPQQASGLVNLYMRFPQAFENNENASLIVAEYLLGQKRMDDYAKLRAKWEKRGDKPEAWFLLDTDQLIFSGKRDQAIGILKSRTFTGTHDTARLIRLALLHANSDLEASWKFLTEAQEKDPKNGQIRLLRGQLLEGINQLALARAEYLAAIELEPKNATFFDQLGEFYRRNGQFALAQQTWLDGLDLPKSGTLWVKSLFWSRVAHVVRYDWKKHKVPDGMQKPLIEYLLTLKPDQFWDEDSFEHVLRSTYYLRTEQATLWLRVLQALKDDNEKAATDLLQFNHFQVVSWAPALQDALLFILNYRKNATFENAIDTKKTTELIGRYEKALKTMPNAHTLYKDLGKVMATAVAAKKVVFSPELEALLKSPDAFSAAVLAQGWLVASLELNRTPVIPAQYPDWLAFGLTQANRYERGHQAALEFATKQKTTPPLSLIVGEILLATGSETAGLEQLQKLAKEDSEVGYRAAWLVSKLYYDQANFDEARKAIAQLPRLSESILGKEMLARSAIREDNTQLAEQIYLELETKSDEAKIFLARKAMQEKKWEKARELVQQLLREYPNNMEFLQMLEVIQREMKGAST